jgi:hypothetical protein
MVSRAAYEKLFETYGGPTKANFAILATITALCKRTARADNKFSRYLLEGHALESNSAG